jgi:hypothetical protein
MKLNLHETHDRYESFTKKNDFDIGECCQDLINKRPFGHHAFYIFAHPRTDDDGVTKRLIWQPRLTRPTPQTNSMLFKAYPGTDLIKVIWVIPDRILWSQYEDGKVTANKTICDSIRDFQFDRQKLERNEDDDLSDEKIDNIYKSLARDANHVRRMKGIKNRIIST